MPPLVEPPLVSAHAPQEKQSHCLKVNFPDLEICEEQVTCAKNESVVGKFCLDNSKNEAGTF